MCATYFIDLYEENQKSQAILRQLGNNVRSVVINGDVYPKSNAAVIHFDSNINSFNVSPMKWGFNDNKSLIINARSETANNTYSFIQSTKCGRCLVPATGFYEWRNSNNIKTKYMFRASAPLLYLAALYKFENGINKFVILTKNANKQMSYYHNRMPLSINNESIKANWINPKNNYIDLINALADVEYNVIKV